MPLIDDLKMPMGEKERTRRAFLGMLGGTAMGLASAGTAVTAVRFLWPEVLFEEESRFRIGRPEEIPIGTLVSLPQQKLYVFHDAQGFVAMSAVCTHLGCLTQYERENGRILCPCHGSRYALDGQVVVGPAPRALSRLQLIVEQGLLVVDSAKVMDADFVLRI